MQLGGHPWVNNVAIYVNARLGMRGGKLPTHAHAAQAACARHHAASLLAALARSANGQFLLHRAWGHAGSVAGIGPVAVGTRRHH